MQQVSSTEREAARLQALHDQAILDTPPEAAFDDIAYLAAEVCGAPVALITFVDRDRQWFKAVVGAGTRECPRSAGFCPLAIERDDLLVVPDALASPLLHDRSSAAAGLPGRFYAGMPLVTADGHAIGTLCVLDHVPRVLQPWQQGALRTLARLVMRELQVRQARRDLDRRKTEAIGTLAGGLARELSHLLVALQEQERLLAARAAKDDPCRTALQRGLEGAQRAAALTRELLGVSRHCSPAPQFVDLNDLITRREPEWQALLGDAVRLRLRLGPDLGRVKADPTQIGRALESLVESVRDDLPRGADLTIATDSVVAAGDPPGRYVAVSIGDRGAEPVPESADAIVEPSGAGFENGGRNGLGLSAAHGIIVQNGGHIESSARPGQGAQVRIFLPSAPADAV